MDYQLFCDKYQPSEKHLFIEFYRLFSEKFTIKNERIAVEKIKRIINATFSLSANQSFANMSLRQLSKESGLSMGGLYSYIQNKQQLARLIHEFLGYFVIKVINQVTTEESTNNLNGIIKAHIFLSETMQPWFFFAFMESKNLSKNERKTAIKAELLMENKLVESIKNGQDKNIFSDFLKAETLAALIKPLLSEWYLKRWKYKNRDVDIDEYAFSVMTFIERGLASPHKLNEGREI